MEIIVRSSDAQRCKIYLSMTLERPMGSYVDSLCAVILNWADFKPLPHNCKKFAAVLTTEQFAPATVPYI